MQAWWAEDNSLKKNIKNILTGSVSIYVKCGVSTVLGFQTTFYSAILKAQEEEQCGRKEREMKT